MTEEELLRKYVEAKEAEDAAKKRRKEIASVIARTFEHPDEGQKTHARGNYKVTVKGVLTRAVDWDEFDLVAKEFPHYAPVRVKRELDVKGMEYYAEHEPEYHAALLKTITNRDKLRIAHFSESSTRSYHQSRQNAAHKVAELPSKLFSHCISTSNLHTATQEHTRQ